MTTSSPRPEKTADQVLLSSERDGVRMLTLNRPDRKNALNPQSWVELADALRAAGRDDSTLAEALANEARAQPGNFATADSGEAYAAFAAKRGPSFTEQWALPPRSEQKDA
jgi:enoyl-CoA hydratase/carnithine racemase